MSILARLNPFQRWRAAPKRSPTDSYEIFRRKYASFKELLDSNAELSKILADMEEKLQGRDVFGMSYVRSQSTRAAFHTLRMIQSLDALSGQKYGALFAVLDRINEGIKEELNKRKEVPITEPVLPYARINKEMVDWVGGKSANLGEVFNHVHLPIPEGFATTTYAFQRFLAENDLVDEINKKIMEVDLDSPEIITTISEEIQALIISAEVPSELESAFLGQYEAMARRIEAYGPGLAGPAPRVSLRSSAIGEDSELSFAGQYLSLLNVTPERLVRSYKFVIASLYTPRAISYRLSKGIRDEDIAMSVACLEMVDSVTSGVMYTHHPFNLLEDTIIISAVWGLGPYAVDGHVTPDTYTVAKDDGRTIVESKISVKPVQLLASPDGGLMESAVAPDMQSAPCLSPEQIRALAEYGLKLERHYRCPQDVEWALDRRGRLLVLQTRPLRTQSPGTGESSRPVPKLDAYQVLVEGEGIAFPGVGCGPAFHVRSEDDLLNFPQGGVLIANHSSPKFMLVMPKAEAIVTESGSITGHMASLAREFSVPSILDAKGVMSAVEEGMEVTVDAYSGRIYEGRVPELLSLKKPKESHMESTSVYMTLKSVAEWIIPLHLVDPKSPDFAPPSCRSLHDIMRLVHEYSYSEMFRISDFFSGEGGWALKLDAPIPIDLYIIDLGGGLTELAAGARKVREDQISSAPFKALLRGMLHEDLRHHRPRPVDLGGFFSVMSEQMLSNSYGSERFGDRSFAIISDKYLNFSSRVGYHYSVLDSYCGQTINKNYISFSFKGGAADDVRRNRRARAISAILKELGFSVEAVADRVDAKLQKYERHVIKDKLDMIGRLLQFTRQMDMLMHSEASVGAIAKSFLEGNYRLDAQQPGGQ